MSGHPPDQDTGQHPLCGPAPFSLTVGTLSWSGAFAPPSSPRNVTPLLIVQHILVERLPEPRSQRFRPPGSYNPTTLPFPARRPWTPHPHLSSFLSPPPPRARGL